MGGRHLYLPDALNNRQGPQAKKPSKSERVEIRRKTGQRGLLIASYKASKKDSDRAITPVAEAVHVPAPLVPPGCPQARQLCYVHAQLSLGQSCHRQKKSCAYEHRVALVVSDSLRPCGLWPARLLCQGWRASPGTNTGVYWPILVAIPF